MNKHILRFVACLLIPCLVGDPVTASCYSSKFAPSNESQIPSDIFDREALSLCARYFLFLPLRQLRRDWQETRSPQLTEQNPKQITRDVLAISRALRGLRGDYGGNISLGQRFLRHMARIVSLDFLDSVPHFTVNWTNALHKTINQYLLHYSVEEALPLLSDLANAIDMMNKVLTQKDRDATLNSYATRQAVLNGLRNALPYRLPHYDIPPSPVGAETPVVAAEVFLPTEVRDDIAAAREEGIQFTFPNQGDGSQVLSHQGQSTYSRFFNPPVEDKLMTENNEFMYVVKRGGTVIGYIVCEIKNSNSDTVWIRDWELWEMQGKGIGTALFGQALLQAVKEWPSVKRVRFITFPESRRAASIARTIFRAKEDPHPDGASYFEIPLSELGKSQKTPQTDTVPRAPNGGSNVQNSLLIVGLAAVALALLVLGFGWGWGTLNTLAALKPSSLLMFSMVGPWGFRKRRHKRKNRPVEQIRDPAIDAARLILNEVAKRNTLLETPIHIPLETIADSSIVHSLKLPLLIRQIDLKFQKVSGRGKPPEPGPDAPPQDLWDAAAPLRAAGVQIQIEVLKTDLVVSKKPYEPKPAPPAKVTPQAKAPRPPLPRLPPMVEAAPDTIETSEQSYIPAGPSQSGLIQELKVHIDQGLVDLVREKINRVYLMVGKNNEEEGNRLLQSHVNSLSAKEGLSLRITVKEIEDFYDGSKGLRKKQLELLVQAADEILAGPIAEQQKPDGGPDAYHSLALVGVIASIRAVAHHPFAWHPSQTTIIAAIVALIAVVLVIYYALAQLGSRIASWINKLLAPFLSLTLAAGLLGLITYSPVHAAQKEGRNGSEVSGRASQSIPQIESREDYPPPHTGLYKKVDKAAERVRKHLDEDHWLGKDGKVLLDLLDTFFVRERHFTISDSFMMQEFAHIRGDNRSIVFSRPSLAQATDRDMEAFIISTLESLTDLQIQRRERIAEIELHLVNSDAIVRQYLAMNVQNDFEPTKRAFVYWQMAARADGFSDVETYLHKKSHYRFEFFIDSSGQLEEGLQRLYLYNILYSDLSGVDRATIQQVFAHEQVPYDDFIPKLLQSLEDPAIYNPFPRRTLWPAKIPIDSNCLHLPAVIGLAAVAPVIANLLFTGSPTHAATLIFAFGLTAVAFMLILGYVIFRVILRAAKPTVHPYHSQSGETQATPERRPDQASLEAA